MSASYDCWYRVNGSPRVRGGLPRNHAYLGTKSGIAPCTRGFTRRIATGHNTARSRPVYAGVYTPSSLNRAESTVAPCTRGFADNDPKPTPKKEQLKHEKPYRHGTDAQLGPRARVTEHAKNLGALAFEVHETESGEYRSIKDAGEYYRNGFTNHPYVEDAIEAGYTLNNWEDLSYADKSEFTEMVELYSEGDDYIAPNLNQT